MNDTKRKIVSSDHLASGDAWPLSEIEFGLTVVHNAFQKWITRCAAAAGQPDLSANDILIVHYINHRDSEKRKVDIAFLLNIDDPHIVNYALKKLHSAGLVSKEKRGKEIFFSTSESGKQFCEDYRSIREDCLIPTLGSLDQSTDVLYAHAQLLRTLSGLYDQAARAAASL